ncbi:MAG: survival protein surA precursor (chaperone surA)-like protein, partial [Ramlibacter sp.]|uniref:peptidylprolyl isomerase n=1 Tax=Ramlibacter sp. TaxID=1917967 RepID=UPI00260B48B0
PDDFIVAVVKAEPITNNEVRSRLLRYEQQLAQQGSPMPPRGQLVREVVERLISERAQLQVAREANLRVDEATVDQAELTVARQNQVDVAELRRRLAADGLALSQFRDDLRNQIMLQRLRDRELESRAKVSEQDIDAFLREQREGNADPALVEVNLAHILVAVPENATPAQVAPLQAKAQQLLARARAGDDFTKLARENSDAPGAAANGGQVGLRTADRYPPLFVEASRGLPVGGVSDLVRSGAGFHIVKLIEKRQPGAAISVTQNHARHILVRPGPNETEAQARARLAGYKRQVEARQADFAALAREHSQDASARNGGDLGWSSPGMFVPEFEEVLGNLTPGQIADPVTSRFGVHLIQLVERRQNQLTEREQRELARNMLREKKLDEAYVKWAEEVRGRAYVELREPPQ